MKIYELANQSMKNESLKQNDKYILKADRHELAMSDKVSK